MEMSVKVCVCESVGVSTLWNLNMDDNHIQPSCFMEKGANSAIPVVLEDGWGIDLCILMLHIRKWMTATQVTLVIWIVW